MKSRIMWIENKSSGDGINGVAVIGRVTFSRTFRTLYYRGKQFQSLKGRGLKANYYDVETGERYWISGCRKDGRDALYAGEAAIDEDVREEYWREIRSMPSRACLARTSSEGKNC